MSWRGCERRSHRRGGGRWSRQLSSECAIRARGRRSNGHLSLKRQFVSPQGDSRAHSWQNAVLVGVSSPVAPSSSLSLSSSFSLATASFRLVGLANVKSRNVDQPGVPTHVFAGMLSEVVCLHVQLRLEDDKLLLHASAVRAQEVVLLEVPLELLVVEEVVRLSRVPSVADEAALVLHAAVLKQLVVVVEALAAEAAQRVALEARLVGGAGPVVAVAHVLLQLLVAKELVLVGEDLFVAGAEVAHALVMGRLDVAMQIGPAKAGKVAGLVGAVVAQQEHAVADNVLVCVLDADVGVGRGEVLVGVVFEALLGVVGEDDIGCRCSAVGAVLGLVQGPHAQATDVARLVVAGRNRVVGHGVGADEADVGIVVVVVDVGPGGGHGLVLFGGRL